MPEQHQAQVFRGLAALSTACFRPHRCPHTKHALRVVHMQVAQFVLDVISAS